MATPFNDVYNIFLSQVTDKNLDQIPEISLKTNLQLWMFSAIGFFSNCRQDLSDFDLTLNQFNADLTITEQQILAKFMVVVYMDTHLIHDSLLKEQLNSKDYRTYSPAAKIKALIEIKSITNSEANTLMSRYSYSIKNLKDLFQ
ncbi:MAG TPA: hypothetical protein VI423_11005 [Paenisporosarcina sp.]|nr:hypothetical protein [Paenisporosarcina sp.]